MSHSLVVFAAVVSIASALVSTISISNLRKAHAAEVKRLKKRHLVDLLNWREEATMYIKHAADTGRTYMTPEEKAAYRRPEKETDRE